MPAAKLSRRRAAQATVSAEPLLGAHMSISGGADKAIERALSIGCTAMQIFVKNNMQWFARPLSEAEVRAFCEHPRRDELKAVFGHSNYLINLATTSPDFHAKSLRALREELIRADQLRLPFLVLHPGAHMGAGVDAGLKQVVSSLDEVFAELPDIKTRVALETTAGQGSSIGHIFEHLAWIIEHSRNPQRLCVCVDTAHLHAAGYDIRTPCAIERTLAQFKKIIGMQWLVAIHLNDSKTALNSRVDRHEHIGQGAIGLEPFRFLLKDPRLRKIPKVLETPKNGNHLAEDARNLAVLRSLLRTAP
jgi:deoxyribonuclease-4